MDERIPPDVEPPRSPRVRWLLFGLGWAFFALGVAGAFLPLLPTTPFMLLALWAFSGSSQRFHDWLYHHRVFGPPLRRWRRERVIPFWVKCVAIASMLASCLWILFRSRPPWWASVGMGAIVLAGTVFLASVPSRPRAAPPLGAAPEGEGSIEA